MTKSEQFKQIIDKNIDQHTDTGIDGVLRLVGRRKY
jgi:hypothetical protein